MMNTKKSDLTYSFETVSNTLSYSKENDLDDK